MEFCPACGPTDESCQQSFGVASTTFKENPCTVENRRLKKFWKLERHHYG